MSHNLFSFEQSNAMRGAIDTVIETLGDDKQPNRIDIARLVLSIANEGDYSVAALTKMTLDRVRVLPRNFALT
jgi:hypothetical protein